MCMMNTIELKYIADQIYYASDLLGHQVKDADNWVFDKTQNGYRAKRIIFVEDNTNEVSKEITFEVNIQISLDGEKL